MKLKDFNWLYELAINSFMYITYTYNSFSKNKQWEKGYNDGFLAGALSVLEYNIDTIEDITKEEKLIIRLELESILHGNDIQEIRDKKSKVTA